MREGAVRVWAGVAGVALDTVEVLFDPRGVPCGANWI